MQLTYPHFIDGRLWGFAEKRPETWMRDFSPEHDEEKNQWLQSKDAIIAEPEFNTGETVFWLFDGEWIEAIIIRIDFTGPNYHDKVYFDNGKGDFGYERLTHYQIGAPYPMEYIKDGRVIEVPREKNTYTVGSHVMGYNGVIETNPEYTQFLQEKKDGLIQIRITNG